MASDADSEDFDKNIENVKDSVKKSFARIYANLKARELKTLRQLEAIRKQCEDDKDLMRNCVQDLHLCFGNEASLLENIYNYGAIDFEKLKFDSKIFTLEDYVSPENDQIYSYKSIKELTKNCEPDLEIEEAASRQVTSAEGCVCYVNIRPEDVAKKFRDPPISTATVAIKESKIKELECTNQVEEDKSSEEKSLVSTDSDPDVKKIEPTEEWLKSIKSQIETEPQITDVMEYSTVPALRSQVSI